MKSCIVNNADLKFVVKTTKPENIIKEAKKVNVVLVDIKMTRKEYLIKLLKGLDTEYFRIDNISACLDGNFSIEQLELIIEILKENNKNTFKEM